MNLILVDDNDFEVGISEKHTAHQNGGHLHRSFSVLLFNNKKELLIHQRSSIKYHTPMLWTNTCCSHPMPGESITNAVKRRLVDELGWSFSCEEIFSFIYRAELEKGMVEHEYDHVFVGICDNVSALNINQDEISDIKWVSISEVCADIEKKPNNYTPWFKKE